MEDGEIKESSIICQKDTLNSVSTGSDSQTHPDLGSASAEPKCSDQAFVEPDTNTQNDDYYEVISADGSIGGDDININDFDNQNLNQNGPGHIVNPDIDNSHNEQCSFLDLPFVPKFEFSSESNDIVKELNVDSCKNPDQYRSNSGALRVNRLELGRSNFDFSKPPPNIQLLNTQIPPNSNLGLDFVSCIHPYPEFSLNTIANTAVPIDGPTSFNSTFSEPVIDTSSATPSVKIPTPDWLDENGDPIKGAFDNIEVKEEASVIKNSKVEYVFSVKEKRNVPVLRGFIRPEYSSAVVNTASSDSSLINTNVLIENVAGNLGLPVENQLGGTTGAVYEEEKKLYLASKSGEDYKAALQSVSPSSSTSVTLPSASKTIIDNANKERYNRFKRNRFTEKKDEPEPETEQKEEPKKTQEEAALESQAVTEILKEVQRGAARAKEHGALGWQKCPIPVTNKTFLRNTLVSTLREPYRPPSKRGRFNVGLHSDESQSKKPYDKGDDDSSRSSRSSRSRSSSRSTRSYSSRSLDDEEFPGPQNKYFRGRGGRGSWPRGQNQYYDAWAAYYGYQQWYGPEAYGMYYGHESWPMDPYTAMYYGDPQAWAEFEAYYGPQNPNFRGRGRGMRGRGRGRGWGGFNEDYRDMEHPRGSRSMSRDYSRSRSRSRSLRSRSWTRSGSSRRRSMSPSLSRSNKRSRSSSHSRVRSTGRSISGSRSRVRSKDDASRSRSRSGSQSKSKKRKHKKKKKKHKKKSKKSHKENPSEDNKQEGDSAEGSQQEKDMSERGNKKGNLSPGSDAKVKIDRKEKKQREEDGKQKIKTMGGKDKNLGHKGLMDHMETKESEGKVRSKDVGEEEIRDEKDRERNSESKDERRKKDNMKSYRKERDSKDSMVTSLPGRKEDRSDEIGASIRDKRAVSRDGRGNSKEGISGRNRSEGSRGAKGDSYGKQKDTLMIVRDGLNSGRRDSRQGSSERCGGKESKVLRKERNEGNSSKDRSGSIKVKDSRDRGDGDRVRESSKDGSGNKGQRNNDSSRGGRRVERQEERVSVSVRSRLGAEYGEKLRKERLDIQHLREATESSKSYKDKVVISKSNIGDSSNAKMMVKEKHKSDESRNRIKNKKGNISPSSEYAQESLKTSKVASLSDKNLTDKEKSKKEPKSGNHLEKDDPNPDKMSSSLNNVARSKESFKVKEKTHSILRDNSGESGSKDKELEKTLKLKKAASGSDGKKYRQEGGDFNQSEMSAKSSTNKKHGSGEKISDTDSKVKTGSTAKGTNSDGLGGLDNKISAPVSSRIGKEMLASAEGASVKKSVKRKKKVMKGGDGIKRRCDSPSDKSLAVQSEDGKKKKKTKKEEGVFKNR